MKRLFLDSMFEFRGRKLNILPELLSDNMRFRGCPLSEERAKTYLIHRYGEENINDTIAALSDAEIETAINDGLCAEMRVFRGEGFHVK